MLPREITVKHNLTGRELKLNWQGQNDPTDDELDEIFASADGQAKPGVVDPSKPYTASFPAWNPDREPKQEFAPLPKGVISPSQFYTDPVVATATPTGQEKHLSPAEVEEAYNSMLRSQGRDLQQVPISQTPGSATYSLKEIADMVSTLTDPNPMNPEGIIGMSPFGYGLQRGTEALGRVGDEIVQAKKYLQALGMTAAGQQIEEMPRAPNPTAAILALMRGLGEFGLGAIVSGTPVGLGFTLGGKMLEEVSPEHGAAFHASQAPAQFFTQNMELSPSMQDVTAIADILYNFALFGAAHKGKAMLLGDKFKSGKITEITKEEQSLLRRAADWVTGKDLDQKVAEQKAWGQLAARIPKKVLEEMPENYIRSELIKSGDDPAIVNRMSHEARVRVFFMKGLHEKKAGADEAPGSTGRGQANAEQIRMYEEQGKWKEPNKPKRNEPNEDVRRIADEYSKERVEGYKPYSDYPVHDKAFAKEVADAYEMLKHDPASPEVQKAYKAFKDESLSQYDYFVERGYKLEPWTKEGQPYKNSREMAEDVRQNKHLFYFMGGDIPKDHPLAEKIPGREITYNDAFRAVHDLVTHAKEGYGFGARGEEAAARAHASMFSPEAQKALFTETRGQNSWVNFGKYGEQNRKNPAGTIYAEQKAAILPDRFRKVSPEEKPVGEPGSWSEAINESLSRVRGEGESLHDVSSVIGMVPYVAEPIIKKAIVEVERLIKKGALDQSRFESEVRRRAIAKLKESSKFSKLPKAQRDALYASLRKEKFKSGEEAQLTESMSVDALNAKIARMAQGKEIPWMISERGDGVDVGQPGDTHLMMATGNVRRVQSSLRGRVTDNGRIVSVWGDFNRVDPQKTANALFDLVVQGKARKDATVYFTDGTNMPMRRAIETAGFDWNARRGNMLHSSLLPGVTPDSINKLKDVVRKLVENREPLTDEERSTVTNIRARGSHVTKPRVTYDDAVLDARGAKRNLWVRQSQDAENTNRTLMTQFTSELLNPLKQVGDVSEQYFDKLYRTRDGFYRGEDYWEVPFWQAQVAQIVKDSDSYTVRDMAEASRFIRESGYKRVAFSALDANRNFIEQLVRENPNTEFVIGGYIQDLQTHFQKYKNVKTYGTLAEFAKSIGVEYQPDFSYRHFAGTRVIPRLKMSEGCKYACIFCTIGKDVKETPKGLIDRQVEAIKDLNAKLVYLDDKTYGQASNYQYLAEIYPRLKEANPEFEGFIVQTTAPDVLRMPMDFLKKSGIKYVEIGVETFNDQWLKNLHKVSRERTIQDATDKLREAGITLIPNIIIGLNGKDKTGKHWEETPQTYQKTLDYLNRNEDVISHVNAYNLAIFEGTELANQIVAKIDADRYEQTRASQKTFYERPQVHEKFHEDLFALGNRLLDREPDFSGKGETSLLSSLVPGVTPERVQKMSDKLKESFGTVRNPFAAGWMVPDGERINFAGKDGEAATYRKYDHRKALDVLADLGFFDAEEWGIGHLMRSGFVRMKPEYSQPGFEVGAPLTVKQKQSLIDYMERVVKNERVSNITVDVNPLWGDLFSPPIPHSRTFPKDALDFNEIFSFVDRALSAKRPQSDIEKFRTGGGLYSSIVPVDPKKLKRLAEYARDSMFFRKWFGDSVLRGDDGTPNILYHQTGAGAAESMRKRGFDIGIVRGRLGEEVFPDGVYLKPTNVDIAMGSTQMPLFARVENPLRVANRREMREWLLYNSDQYQKLYRRYEEIGNDVRQEIAEVEKRYTDPGERVAAKRDIREEFDIATDALASDMRAISTKELLKQGYDGLIVRMDEGSFNRRTESIIPLSPLQVKAVDNNGNFSTVHPSLLMSTVIPGLTPKKFDKLVETVARLTEKNGGATYNLKRGNMVGAKGLSAVGLKSKQLDPGADLRKELASWIQENSALLADDRFSIGTWVEKNDAGVPVQTWLEVSATLPHKRAIGLAKRLDEKAIYDLGRWRETRIGGSGVKPPGVDPLAILNDVSSLDLIYEPLSIKGKGGVKAAGQAFEQETKRRGRLPVTDEEKIQRALDAGMEELRYQIAQEHSGLGWYKDDVQAHRTEMTKVFPELENDTKVGMYRAVLTPTSYGSNPFQNNNAAARIWEVYRKTGRFPVRQPNGAGWTNRAGVVEAQLSRLNRLLDEKGEQGAFDWLMSEHPVSELRKWNGNVGGKASDMKHGAMIFGVKGGNFFLNLNGIETEVTKDMWFSRTWNRWMGTMFDENGNLQEQPRNAAERRIMDQAVRLLGQKLNLSEADVQAALWYYEKRLWEKHGSRSERISYGTAARRYNESRAQTELAFGTGQAGGRVGQAGADAVTGTANRGGQGGSLNSNIIPGADKVAETVRQLAPVFYSQLKRTIELERQEKFTGQQLLHKLENSPGVKAEELYWTGLDDFLKSKSSVTRAEVLEYLKRNEVQVVETTLGDPTSRVRLNEKSVLLTPEVRKVLQQESDRGSIYDRVAMSLENDGDAYRSVIRKLQKKHELQWSEDGGVHSAPDGTGTYSGDYVVKKSVGDRYVLFVPDEYDSGRRTYPTLEAAKAAAGDLHREMIESRWEKIVLDDVATFPNLRDRRLSVRHGDPNLRVPGSEPGTYRELLFSFPEGKLGGREHTTYPDGHYAGVKDNVFLHVRYDVRNLLGKRTRFVEEFQSDWHQKGRKEGYRGWGGKLDAVERVAYWEVYDERGFVSNVMKDEGFLTKESAIAEAQRRIIEEPHRASRSSSVPDAPFKSTWHELALRRMVRLAAENGDEQLAWTGGKIQSERYDLSRHIKEVYWQHADDGGFYLSVVSKDGNVLLDGGHVQREELAAWVGRPLAEKIVKKNSGELTGLDLKVEDTGMSGFYDDMMVRYANRFGKKFGASVQTVELNGKLVHVLPITESMKRSALDSGVQLFSSIIPGGERIGRIIEPLLKAASDEVKRLVDNGELGATGVPSYLRKRVIEAMESHPELAAFMNRVGRENVEEYISNINLAKYEESARLGIRRMVEEEDAGRVQQQRRGVRTWEETEQAARGEQEVVKRAYAGEIKPGTAFNAEQLEAIRSEANTLGKLTPKEAIDRAGGAEQLASFLSAWHGSITEAGRALNIMRKGVDPSVAETFAKLAADAESPKLKEALQKTIDSLNKDEKVPPGYWEMLAELGRNVKLASISSLVRSVVGNATSAVIRFPEIIGSAAANRVLSAVTGKRRDRYSRELAAGIIGSKAGMRQGLRTAWDTVMEDLAAINENVFLQRETGQTEGAIPGKAGWIIRMPQRLQGAIDAAFRIPGGEGLKYQYAIRQALQEGLVDGALLRRVEELVLNPPETMIERLQEDAAYLTYQGKLGAMGGAINKMRISHPIMQLPIPFFSTWANLFKMAVERTPLSVLTPSFHQAVVEAFGKEQAAHTRWQKSWAKFTGQEWTPGIGRLSDKLSRMATGTTAMLVTSALISKVLDGEITGRGDDDKEVREAKMRQGWQPYSVRVGDTYVSYRGYEPFGTWLAMIADASGGQVDGEGFKRATKELMRNFAQNPFMVGVRDIMDALLDDDSKKVERMISGFIVGMIVPNIVQQTAKVIDPAYRQPESVGEGIKSRLPVVSKSVLPKRDVFGRIIESETGAGRLVAVTTSKRKYDPVDVELERLGVQLSMPGKTQAKVKLSPQEYDKFVEIVGKNLYLGLKSLIGRPDYKGLDDELKRKVIRRVQDNVRDVQRKLLLMEKSAETTEE